jgi:hypothetical protein
MNKNDTPFVQALSEAFQPPATDAEAFDARLQARLNEAWQTRARRPVFAAVLLAAAAVLLLMRPMEGTIPAETPAPTPIEVASIDTASAALGAFSLYRFDEFDPLDTTEFPEDYQRLASLFLN